MALSETNKTKKNIHDPDKFILSSDKEPSITDTLQTTIAHLHFEKEIPMNTICDLKLILSQLSTNETQIGEINQLDTYTYTAKKLRKASRAAGNILEMLQLSEP